MPGFLPILSLSPLTSLTPLFLSLYLIPSILLSVFLISVPLSYFPLSFSPSLYVIPPSL